MNRHRTQCSVIAMLTTVGLASPQAHAQDARATTDQPTSAAAGQNEAVDAASQADQSAGVQDIIVTAQRRSESAQTVPISIAAVSGDTLVKTGVDGIGGLERVAPGLTISAVGSGFVSYTYIRGGGTNQIDPGSDPSVAYFVDEVYIGGTAGLQFDLFDIDHVEVLKGPQGTLFGRNASSGAISVVTRRPSDKFSGNFNLEGGKYGYLVGRGGVTGPINSDGSLRYRVSGVYKRRNPFTENLSGGPDPDKVRTGGARGQLEWVSGDLDVLASADYLRVRNGQTNQFISTADRSGWVNGALPLQPNQSFFKHYYDVDGFEHQTLYDASLRVELTTPIGSITSLSAYRNSRFTRSQDQDATSYDGYILNSDEHDKTFSQELRLAGDSGRLRYVGGLYYYHATIDSVFDIIADAAFPTAAVRGRRARDQRTLTTDSYAAFGQVTYEVTDALDLTAGARFTEDRKEDDRSVRGFFAVTPFQVDPKANFRAFNPAGTISYKPRPGLLAYFSYRQGFKSGGFQGLLPGTPAIAGTPFKPEDVTSYELGVKSAFLDRRVRANVALFRADITNQQISRIASASSVLIDNAGRTRTDGVDVSLTVKPVSALTLTADGTLQHARFKKFLNGAISYAGNHQLRSPDFTGFFSAEYEAQLSDGSAVTLRGDYSYKSKTFYDAANSSFSGIFQPGYGVANARLTYTPISLPVELSAYVKNVTNKHYFVNVAVAGATGLATPGEPLTFGGSLNLRF